MSPKDKIQHLLIKYLMEKGHIELNLPDGMTVHLGILGEGEDGKLAKSDDYCWLIAAQKEREVSIDSYNLGLKFEDNKGKIILEDSSSDITGKRKRSFSVI